MIWAMFFLSCAMVLLVAGSVWQGHRSRNWPVTKAKVLHAGISEAQNTHSSANRTFYRPQVTYEFYQHGVRRRSSRIGFYPAPGMTTKQMPQEIVSQFPEGAELTAYYHPYLPWLSVLIPGFKQPVIHLLLGSVGLLLALLTGSFLFLETSFLERVFSLIYAATS